MHTGILHVSFLSYLTYPNADLCIVFTSSNFPNEPKSIFIESNFSNSLISVRPHLFIFSAAELVVDRALELDHIGGVFGANVKPSPFLCLILKMLQIQPSKDIIIEFIKNPDYKWAGS